MATILAIDWGKKRVGVARADDKARIAEPLTTISNDQGLLVKLSQVAAGEKAQSIVVGLPRNLSGQETAQSQEVRLFAARLEETLQCQVSLQDETLTSTLAADLKQRYPDADEDSLAATIILNDYLEEI